ncbi:hypothetical protein FRC15_001677 [Serendipita sp. 397]|nr:hypothetical protein FRC15_001677 [Serendipita sp. 397]KAG8802080.1 hypothetical protein FRC16_010453 [Serendipita sp. 398]
MATPNPARLSALGSKTLTLAMERQRLLSISPPSSSSPLRPAGANPGGSVGQITKNLTALREGIINIENSQGPSKQTQALREQYQSVLGILGEDEVSAAGIESLPVPPQRRVEPLIPSAVASSLQQQGTTFKDDPQETNEDMYMQQTQIMRGIFISLFCWCCPVSFRHRSRYTARVSVPIHRKAASSLVTDQRRAWRTSGSARGVG